LIGLGWHANDWAKCEASRVVGCREGRKRREKRKGGRKLRKRRKGRKRKCGKRNLEKFPNLRNPRERKVKRTFIELAQKEFTKSQGFKSKKISK
jgi:hypothetical protein